MMQSILKRFDFLRSLKAHLFICIFIAGIIPGVFMRHAILQNYEERAVSVRISDVSNQLKVIANHLITYGYLQGNTSEVIDAELNQLASLYDGRVLIINSDLRVVKDNYGISQGKLIISEEVINCLKNQGTSKYDKNDRFIEITTPIVETLRSDSTLTGTDNAEEQGEKVHGVMLTSVSTDNIIATMEILNRHAILIEIVFNVVVFGLAILLANILDKPFKELSRLIRERGEGYTDTPIMVRGYSETEDICDAFNSVQSRMKVLDDSRNEFVSNVSHELKTPITSMKVLADSLLAQEDVPVEFYKEFMEDIAAEIDREDKIINDLLALVKMDKTAAKMNVSQVDINMLVELVLKRLRPIARKQDIELVFESIRAVTAAVDEVKLTLVISNLVENAIKYNKEHGWVKVTLDADHQFFEIKVADSGIGIPEESLDQIFERFYRVDKSHSREIGGTGLGLAITRNAILMHRGSIKVTSVPGEGTTFLVRIPLTYIATS